MGTQQLHHTGVLVADIDQAATFYLDAFEGHWLFKPAPMSGDQARNVFGGGPDVEVRFGYIGFESGAIELVQFIADPPDYAREPEPGRLPHFAVVVDDVHATTERVVAAGGRKVWDEPVSWGEATVMYVADPDGNAIELFDVPLEKIVDLTIELYPDSAP